MILRIIKDPCQGTVFVPDEHSSRDIRFESLGPWVRRFWRKKQATLTYRMTRLLCQATFDINTRGHEVQLSINGVIMCPICYVESTPLPASRVEQRGLSSVRACKEVIKKVKGKKGPPLQFWDV